jgi:hypothetical protein
VIGGSKYLLVLSYVIAGTGALIGGGGAAIDRWKTKAPRGGGAAQSRRFAPLGYARLVQLL